MSPFAGVPKVASIRCYARVLNVAFLQLQHPGGPYFQRLMKRFFCLFFAGEKRQVPTASVGGVFIVLGRVMRGLHAHDI